jgi:hypothetical protein
MSAARSARAQLGVFSPGTPLLALPSWRAPRLLLSQSGGLIRRWQNSAFYPATRPTAKLYRLGLRMKAALGCGKTYPAVTDRWVLPEFVEDCLPAVASIVLQTRPSGPNQKFTVELRDRDSAVVGYIKYATEGLARRRLAQEYAMLMRLPAGFGPTPLKFGKMGDGVALLVTPLCGRKVGVKLPPSPEVVAFAKSLEIAAPVPFTAHPYIRAVREHFGTRLDPVLEDLAAREWPIVLQHGDLVPWNLRRRRQSNALAAFDWEFGTPDGFPYTDLAYFVLQTALLIYSWPAIKSTIYTMRWLHQRFDLGEREARALVRLAMVEAYLHGRDNGYPDDHPIQAWRLRIWRGLW